MAASPVLLSASGRLAQTLPEGKRRRGFSELAHGERTRSPLEIESRDAERAPSKGG